jgi:hypothetical protein
LDLRLYPRIDGLKDGRGVIHLIHRFKAFEDQIREDGK